MPLPPVVIELSTADAASPHAPGLVAACSQSVSDGDCRLGASKAGDPEPRAVAIVSWTGEKTSHIELGVRRRGEVRWIERDLAFRAEDPAEERWRSVGLVIGTLVGEAEAEARAEEDREPKRPRPVTPKPARPRPSPRSIPQPASVRAPAESPPRLWIGLDGLAGPALDDGSWRFGGGLFARYLSSIRPLAATATLRYTLRPEADGVGVSWLDAGAGVGASVPLSGELQAHCGVLANVEQARATATAGAASESGSRWLSGARVAGDLVWSPDRRWGIGLGAELGWRSGETTIRVADRDVGSVPTWAYLFQLGARWSPL